MPLPDDRRSTGTTSPRIWPSSASTAATSTWASTASPRARREVPTRRRRVARQRRAHARRAAKPTGDADLTVSELILGVLAATPRRYYVEPRHARPASWTHPGDAPAGPPAVRNTPARDFGPLGPEGGPPGDDRRGPLPQDDQPAGPPDRAGCSSGPSRRSWSRSTSTTALQGRRRPAAGRSDARESRAGPARPRRPRGRHPARTSPARSGRWSSSSG